VSAIFFKELLFAQYSGSISIMYLRFYVLIFADVSSLTSNDKFKVGHPYCAFKLIVI
jgi:hypothetical protein